jgi:thiamine-monophosphate kinase
MRTPSNEDTLLKRIARAFPASRSRAIALGIGDDAALLAPRPGRETILTCDWFLEGTHFLRDKHPARAVGWKCLARAMSDIAAMGGTPRCFLLSLALPPSHTGPWLTEFLDGLRRASRVYRCELAGGDTTRRSEILISITAVGDVAKRRALLRSGARPGDRIFVSGTLGEAERGLRHLRKMRGAVKSSDPLLRKHFYPEPRVALGQWLAGGRLATATMDLSDGLSSDLPRLCAASAVGARVDAVLLPLIPGAKKGEAMSLALDGGDDYELLFTVAPKNLHRIPDKFHKVCLHNIGVITREKEVRLHSEGESIRSLRRGGWDPFRN